MSVINANKDTLISNSLGFNVLFTTQTCVTQCMHCRWARHWQTRCIIVKCTLSVCIRWNEHTISCIAPPIYWLIVSGKGNFCIRPVLLWWVINIGLQRCWCEYLILTKRGSKQTVLKLQFMYNSLLLTVIVLSLSTVATPPSPLLHLHHSVSYLCRGEANVEWHLVSCQAIYSW